MRLAIRFIIILFLVGINISCDQITKKEVRERISENEVIQVLNSNFILTKVENTGAALSMGSNLTPFAKVVILQVLPSLMLISLLFYIITKRNISHIYILAFTFIIGGGIGNIMDRILYNSVTDFMFVEIGPFRTGIFNMADVSVYLGVSILLMASLFKSKRSKNKASI